MERGGAGFGVVGEGRLYFQLVADENKSVSFVIGFLVGSTGGGIGGAGDRSPGFRFQGSI